MTIWFSFSGVKGHTLAQEHGPAIALVDRLGNECIISLTPNLVDAFCSSLRNFCSELDPGYGERLLNQRRLQEVQQVRERKIKINQKSKLKSLAKARQILAEKRKNVHAPVAPPSIQETINSIQDVNRG